jgi:hypothetical protein
MKIATCHTNQTAGYLKKITIHKALNQASYGECVAPYFVICMPLLLRNFAPLGVHSYGIDLFSGLICVHFSNTIEIYIIYIFKFLRFFHRKS